MSPAFNGLSGGRGNQSGSLAKKKNKKEVDLKLILSSKHRCFGGWDKNRLERPNIAIRNSSQIGVRLVKNKKKKP